MSFQTFVFESGLKVLAMARLSECEYSIVFYLLNCAASGLDELITTSRELSSLVGYDEATLQENLSRLSGRNIIRVKRQENTPVTPDRPSLRIGIQWEISQWALNFESDITSHDAVVFPFRRGNNLHLIEMPEKSDAIITKVQPTWKRVFNEFAEDRRLEEEELRQAERDSRILVETHPVDQVLLMLRHFQHRIPTLSLLASSWQHYQEVFESETQKVDLMGARQKHLEQDDYLRKIVHSTLEKREELSLSEEEVNVLEILNSHRHPRRQLFWAYQSRSRYPNLKGFFSENSRIMLPVTSNGIVIKKRPHQDS